MSDVMQHVNETRAINLSESARGHLLACLDKEKACKGVRLSVKKSGCSGLSYVVDYVQCIEPSDQVFPLNDVYQIYIAKASYPYLQGMSIDYVKQGLNYKFVFTNPNQTGQCGCGESFTVEPI